ncbi:hypothetical protein D3C84_1092010 [compost metagenome]
MPEELIPLPVLPARSATPVLARLMTLVALMMPAVGVNVAVQVIPPSLLLTEVNVPLAMLRSALVKPVTASEKVMVTSEVSPAVSAVSASTIVAVGRSVSMA